MPPLPLPRWRLAKPLRASIERGHPWIYDRALVRPAPAPAGAVVTIVDDAGAIATAFADPDAPIAARVIDGAAPDAPIDDGWAEHRAATAAGRRIGDPLLVGCDGLRWIHGENDRCPGLVVDGYAGTVVIAFDGAGAAAFWGPRVPAVIAGLRRAGATVDAAWVKGDRGGEPYAIGEVADDLVIRERDARFGVDVRRGQKTGFFLDQRLNRFVIGAHAADARVLNLFAYTGGFSVHAGLGGARRVTSVDIAAPAIAAAAANLTRSGLDPAAHELVAEDAFAFLARATAAGRRWDLVISDPPSFAPSERARPAALKSYGRLARAALAVVEPGGLLAFASCSSHVSRDDLLGVLADAGAARGAAALNQGGAAALNQGGAAALNQGGAAALNQGGLRVRQALGAASDHPTLPGFPEGQYLDFLLCDTG